MIPDFKQQISELEKQKQDLEIRLNEQVENMKGNWNPHETAFRKRCPLQEMTEKSWYPGVSNSDFPPGQAQDVNARNGLRGAIIRYMGI